MTDNKTESIRTKIFKAVLYGDFSPGDKLPTERDMAERTGTSRVTVRRAYEQLEHSGILQREQGRGTFVSSYVGGNPRPGDQIALLSSVSDPFALEFIRELEKKLSAEDMLLILRITDESAEKEEQAAIELVGKGVNNLIIWPSGHRFAKGTFERLRVLGTNMVFFDRMMPGAYADYVGLDNDDAMKQLFSKAASRNLSAPVFVTHSDLMADSDKMRQEAFLEQCRHYQIESRVIELPQMGKVLSCPDIIGADDTVFCVNDAMAKKLEPFVDRNNLYGIDGLFGVEFVSCRQPMVDYAATAVSLLLNQQKKGERWKASRTFIKGSLINE